MPVLKTPDVDLYYELNGSGEPIVLIQGVGMIGRGWEPQVAGLSATFQTLTFDNRGIGQSALRKGGVSIELMASDVLKLMDSLGWESAHIVGHSMGGVIAQQFALDNPTKVRSLTLLCSFSSGKDVKKLTSRIIMLGLRSKIGSKKMRRQAFLEMLFSKQYLQTNKQHEELATIVGELSGRDLAESPPVIDVQLHVLGLHDCSGRLGELGKIPTLIISADEDPIARPEFSRKLNLAIPESTLLELKGASHGIVIERASEVNTAILDFLNGLVRGAGAEFNAEEWVD